MAEEKVSEALKRLVEVHRGWCNYCKGGESACTNAPAGGCSLRDYLVALSAPPSNPGDERRKAMEADQWLLQDTRQHVGNDVLFWAAGGGYTTDVSKAERFTLEKAERQQRIRDTDMPWPVAYIASKTRPVVDFQYLDHAEALSHRERGGE